MSPYGDDGYEMPRPDPFDDDAIDALLAGSPLAGDGGVSAFVDDVRAAARAVPTPSPMLATAIAAGGISTPHPVTQHAVTQHPVTQHPVTTWRKYRMKIKGFLAGLGVAGKVALGVGVAAAATTGAGAAGVLPGSVQHAVSKAVDAVSPFSFPDPDHHGPDPDHHGSNGDELASGATTTTTLGDSTATTKPDGEGDGSGDGGNGFVTPTTDDHHGTGEVTTTTVKHDGEGNTTPTTERHGDGDNNNPESLSIQCTRTADPRHISCSWSAATGADHARYVLLRTGGEQNRVVLESEDAVSFTDTSVAAGTEYGYRVDSLRADGSVAAHSPLFEIECCGGVPTTTPTTEHHESTTTTTEHHESTTTTTEPHESTTTTTVH